MYILHILKAPPEFFLPLRHLFFFFHSLRLWHFFNRRLCRSFSAYLRLRYEVIDDISSALFLEPIGIPERIERVVTTGMPRTHAGYHDDLLVLSGSLEGVSEHQCEFGASIRYMRVISLPQGPDALLKCQQALVNLCPFDPSLAVVADTVLGPLASLNKTHCKVYQTQLALEHVPLAQSYLANGVRSRRVLVGGSGVRGPHRTPVVYHLKQFLLAGGSVLY